MNIPPLPPWLLVKKSKQPFIECVCHPSCICGILFFFQPQNGFLSYTGFFPAIALSPLKGQLIRCTAVRRLSSTLILWGHLSLLSLTASQPGLLFVKWTLLSYLGSFVFPTALEIFIVGKYLTFFTSESLLPLHSKVCLADCACRVDVRKKSLQE